MPEQGRTEFIKVKTTLPTHPLPPNPERPPIQTARLIIRPFAPGDLAGIHALRAQAEVMEFSSAGRPDRDLAETRAFMDGVLAPRDAETFNHAVCLAATGELVGVGGVRGLGYLFNREHWGRGYATEFLRAWLRAWWALPRSEAVVEVDAQSVSGGEEEVPEMLYAMVEERNSGSVRVLEKLGFRMYERCVVPEDREGRDPVDVPIVRCVLSKADWQGREGLDA
ncbi:acetyltransferase domain-containing protein [Xylariaceae sp. FL0662B]|nr:acetyltransferase domain-containing protein [Xylariaceae sp. FL0662B]